MCLPHKNTVHRENWRASIELIRPPTLDDQWKAIYELTVINQAPYDDGMIPYIYVNLMQTTDVKGNDLPAELNPILNAPNMKITIQKPVPLPVFTADVRYKFFVTAELTTEGRERLNLEKPDFMGDLKQIYKERFEIVVDSGCEFGLSTGNGASNIHLGPLIDKTISHSDFIASTQEEFGDYIAQMEAGLWNAVKVESIVGFPSKAYWDEEQAKIDRQIPDTPPSVIAQSSNYSATEQPLQTDSGSALDGVSFVVVLVSAALVIVVMIVCAVVIHRIVLSSKLKQSEYNRLLLDHLVTNNTKQDGNGILNTANAASDCEEQVSV